MHQEAISKSEAAQRQLNCAIRLLFEGEDSLAVHTLAYAAFKVLYDIAAKRSGANAIQTIIADVGWRYLTTVPNFLKFPWWGFCKSTV